METGNGGDHAILTVSVECFRDNPLPFQPDFIAFSDLESSSTMPIQALRDLLQEEMSAIDDLILEKMRSDVPLIPLLGQYIVQGGGKRLRPVLLVACARMLGDVGPRPIALAAVVEFIHTATLLHDDVVDASDLRRGRDSANAVWGNQASVLVGDFLFSRAFEMMVADGDLDVLRILSRASRTLGGGRGAATGSSRGNQ